MAIRNTRHQQRSAHSVTRRVKSRNDSHAQARRDSKSPPVEGATEFRLQKFLASAGLGSRRQCEELIRSGRITINGIPVENPGVNVDPNKQSIEYDGEKLKPQKLKYFVLNKPKGVLCTNNDPEGRTRVIDLFPHEKVRLFPVGRLDEESEGLLVVTNDGDLAHQLAHPRYRIYRTYRIQVAGHPSVEQLQKLRDGIFFREGKFKVISVRVAGKKGRSTFLEVVLGEGHNREVRRLFARIGHKVMSLERLAFGPIKLAKLKRGAYRPLTTDELAQLREMLTRNRSTPLKQNEHSGKKQNENPGKKQADHSGKKRIGRSIKKHVLLTPKKKSITRSSRENQSDKRTTSSNKRKPKTYIFK